MKTILILDMPDRPLEDLAKVLRIVTGGEFELDSLFDSQRLIQRLRREPEVQMVFLDWFRGDGRRSGAQIIREIRVVRPKSLALVAVADEGNVQIVSTAVSVGATNFLVLGDELEQRVRTLLEKIRRMSSLFERNRQLHCQNLELMERAADRDKGEEITPEDPGLSPVGKIEEFQGDFQEKVNAFQKSLILDALYKSSGNQAMAARVLGMSYHQFRYYYRKVVRKRRERRKMGTG